MPNIVAVQELVNGPRHLVLKLDIEGDGSGDIDEPLLEVAAYSCPEVRLDSVVGSVDGFALNLKWGGTTLAPLINLTDDGPIDHDWCHIGGLTNPKVANYSGDVDMTSTGLGAGDKGSLTFHFYKKRIA